MRLLKRAFFYISLTIIIVNLPIVSEVLSFIFYDTVGTPFQFITKDAQFYATGDVKKISTSEHYLSYVKQYPNADHTLYRCFREKDWRYVFLWRIFLTNHNWRAPYIPDPFFISQYRGDYDTWFNGNPRPYKWDDNAGIWIKVAK